jgi:hypothetical protein
LEIAKLHMVGMRPESHLLDPERCILDRLDSLRT